jgi:hypothetical protein
MTVSSDPIRNREQVRSPPEVGLNRRRTGAKQDWGKAVIVPGAVIEQGIVIDEEHADRR